MMSTTLVFDASAGVKWFRPDEAGATGALELLGSAGSDVWLPDQCAHEIVNVVYRRHGQALAAEAWRAIDEAGVVLGRADAETVAEALSVAAEFGCGYYDALAPALARLLGATLVSADRRAHATFPGVVILG